jgi:hypothetical protein
MQTLWRSVTLHWIVHNRLQQLRQEIRHINLLRTSSNSGGGKEDDPWNVGHSDYTFEFQLCYRYMPAFMYDTVACRPISRQRQWNKQLDNGRY